MLNVGMKTHEVVLDVKLVFQVPAKHEVVAMTEAITWLGERLTKGEGSILKTVGLNLGEKQE